MYQTWTLDFLPKTGVKFKEMFVGLTYACVGRLPGRSTTQQFHYLPAVSQVRGDSSLQLGINKSSVKRIHYLSRGICNRWVHQISCMFNSFPRFFPFFGLVCVLIQNPIFKDKKPTENTKRSRLGFLIVVNFYYNCTEKTSFNPILDYCLLQFYFRIRDLTFGRFQKYLILRISISTFSSFEKPRKSYSKTITSLKILISKFIWNIWCFSNWNKKPKGN